VEFTDIKAPEPLNGIPPWQDPQWLADAQDWIEASCARAGLTRTGPVSARGRPYSVVARVPTDRGTVWFKACPPVSGFEPALLAAFASWHPDRFAAPLAVDVDRAWVLTRDGGRTLREDLEQQPDTRAWHATVRDYARLQLDLANRADDLIAFGVPDLRPASVPGRLEMLLADPAVEQVIDVAHADVDGQSALASAAILNRVLAGNVDERGFVTSEHRYLAIAQSVRERARG
jgi:hypothetical protein